MFVGQAAPPASAFQVAGIAGIHQHAGHAMLYLVVDISALCHIDWSLLGHLFREKFHGFLSSLDLCH